MKKRIFCFVLLMFIFLCDSPFSHANDPEKKNFLISIATESVKAGIDSLHFGTHSFLGTLLILQDVVLEEGLTQRITSGDYTSQTLFLNEIIFSSRKELYVRLVALELLLYLEEGRLGEDIVQMVAHSEIPPLFKAKILNIIKNSPPQIFHFALYDMILRPSPLPAETPLPLSPNFLPVEVMRLGLEVVANIKGTDIPLDCLLALSQIMHTRTYSSRIRLQALLTYSRQQKNSALAIEEMGSLMLDDPSETIRVRAFRFLLDHRANESARTFIESARERIRSGGFVSDSSVATQLLKDSSPNAMSETASMNPLEPLPSAESSGKIPLSTFLATRRTLREASRTLEGQILISRPFFVPPETPFILEVLFRLRKTHPNAWSPQDIIRALVRSQRRFYPASRQELTDRWTDELNRKGIITELLAFGRSTPADGFLPYREVAHVIEKAFHLIPRVR